MTPKINGIGMERVASAKRILRSSTLKKLLCRLEMGEADTFGFTNFTSGLWFILLVGIIIAFIGFYRIGANYANDYGTRIGAVNADEAVGKQRQSTLLSQFATTPGTCADCYEEVLDERQAKGGFTVQSGILSILNIQASTGDFDINAQSRVRLERFYPGPAKCDAAGKCFE